MIKKVLLVMAACFLLTSCADTGVGPSENSGGSSGADSSVSSDAGSSSAPSMGQLSDEDRAFRDSYQIKDRYITFFLTNTSVYQADGLNEGRDADKQYTFVGEIPALFGEQTADSPYKYAFGLPGPMLLLQSVAEMNEQVEYAFDLAERYNVPVYFQLDDCNSYTAQFGNGSPVKPAENPDWCEWVAFRENGEQWGGQSNGRLPYYWYNWGDWRYVEYFPNLASQGLQDYVVSQLKEGVLKPLVKRYKQLREQGKEYLFAGMAIGWETHIPDYSSANTLSNIDKNMLPKAVTGDVSMAPWEAGRYGYSALTSLGKTEYDIEALYGVIHDYIELLAKTCYDAGIPRAKLYSHIVGYTSANGHIQSTFTPPIWTAVNDYCIPGFTLNPISCPYNLDVLTQKIQAADPAMPYFGSVESYALGVDGSFEAADYYFDEMFSKGALMISVFGWGREPQTSRFAVSHSPDNPFVQAAKHWLNK